MMSQNRAYFESVLASQSQSKEEIYEHFLISFQLCSTNAINDLISKSLRSGDYSIFNNIESDFFSASRGLFESNYNKAMIERLKTVTSKYLLEKELTVKAFIEFIIQQMIQFAEEVTHLLQTISFDEQCEEINELIINLNKTWRDDLDVELHSLDLYYFRQEVKRVYDLDTKSFSLEQKTNHEEFVTQLNEYDKCVSKTLQQEIMPKDEYYPLFEYPDKRNMLNIKDIPKARDSETNQLLKKTTSMLSQLSYQQADREKDTQGLYTFKAQIEASKGINFKSLISLAFAGIGFILGVPCGIVSALLSTPYLGTVGLKQLYTIPYNSAVLGKNIGERLTGGPHQSINNLLFFKSPMEKHVTGIQKAGKKFLGPSKEKHEEISHETLAHYFSFK